MNRMAGLHWAVRSDMGIMAGKRQRLPFDLRRWTIILEARRSAAPL